MGILFFWIFIANTSRHFSFSRLGVVSTTPYFDSIASAPHDTHHIPILIPHFSRSP
jgi:hypothetical protein